MSKECPQGRWPFYKHQWRKHYWDKFGTGRKEGIYLRCSRCFTLKVPRYPKDRV